jgi:hypothetical protein
MSIKAHTLSHLQTRSQASYIPLAAAGGAWNEPANTMKNEEVYHGD